MSKIDDTDLSTDPLSLEEIAETADMFKKLCEKQGDLSILFQWLAQELEHLSLRSNGPENTVLMMPLQKLVADSQNGIVDLVPSLRNMATSLAKLRHDLMNEQDIRALERLAQEEKNKLPPTQLH